MELQNYELSYARIKLPYYHYQDDQPLIISNDCKEIYYYDHNQRQKVIIYDDLNLDFKHTYDFMQVKLVKDGNKWFKIILDINVNKFSESLRQPFALFGRRNLFGVLGKCLDELRNNYILHSILNLYDDVVVNNDIHLFREWFNGSEMDVVEYYYLPNYVLKVGNCYVDLNKGKMVDVRMDGIRRRGGIIYDTGYNWIDCLVKCMGKNNNVVLEQNTLINTNCTMIICDMKNCLHWSKKLLLYNSELRIKIICNKKDYVICYNDILDLDYLIINYEFVLSKYYGTIIDDCKMGNSYEEIMNGIGSFEKIKNSGNVILSLIKWNRIIFDSMSIANALDNKNHLDLIMTLKCNYRWIQINEMISSKENFEDLLKIIFSDGIILPLYDNHLNVKYVNNMIFMIKNETNINVKEECVLIRSGFLEKQIINYFDKIEVHDINKIHETINIIYSNVISRQMYVDMLEKLDLNAEFDNLKCSICLENNDYDKLLYTKCGHYYCICCMLEHLHYNNQCPLCRAHFDLSNIYYIDDEMKNNKTNELIKLIKNLDNNIIVYTNGSKSKKSLLTYLKRYGIKQNHYKINWLCTDILKNMICINYHSEKNINIVLYDINEDIDKIKENIKSNTIQNCKIYYLVYDILKNRIK